MTFVDYLLVVIVWGGVLYNALLERRISRALKEFWVLTNLKELGRRPRVEYPEYEVRDDEAFHH